MIKELIKKSLQLFANEVSVGVINLITGIFLARALGPEFFGFWGILVMILMYGESFGRIKSDIASIYVAGKSKYTLLQLISAANIITVISSSIVILIFVLTSEYIFIFLFKGYENLEQKINLLAYLCSSFICQNFYLNYQYLFLARQNSLLYGLVSVSRSLLFLIFCTALYIFDVLNIDNILISLIVSYGVNLIFLIIRLHTEIGVRPEKIPDALFSELIKRGFQYYLIGISSTLNNSVSLIFVTQLFGPYIIGIFVLAKNLSELIYSRIGAAFNTIIYTTISNSREDEYSAYELANQIFKTIFKSFLFIYFITFFVWEAAIKFFYGDSYLNAVNIILILSVGFLIFSSTQILINYFYGIGQEYIVKYFYFSGFFIQLIPYITLKELKIFIVQKFFKILF